MDTQELKPGQQIGVFYYDDNRGTKAKIEEVKKVSPTGQVTLKNGTRYSNKGYEMGTSFDRTKLCSVEKAQALINKAIEAEQKHKAQRQAYLASPEGKRETVTRAVTAVVIQTLNQHGWYADVDGHMDVLESTVGQLVKEYVDRHEPLELL